jgi:hypothetical protein
MEVTNHASKLKDWEKKYNWDNCKTDREEFGLFIANFLTSDSRVINLNGIYGSGKTEFIRRLYVELANQKHPVVYIDVWESDFSNNPLAVICSELLQQIEYVFKEKAPNGKAKNKSEAKKTFNQLKGKLGTCLQYLEAGIIFTGEPSSIAATKLASKVVSTTKDLPTNNKPQQYIEAVQKNHIEAVQAVKDIKEHITFLSELIETIYELNIPIVILIDELDRCRPTYAIEVLEAIKHFFETKGCTFLVATNTEVLEHSVKSVYGVDFDAKLYLRRFFDRKISLPPVSLLNYLTAKELDFDKYDKDNLLIYPFIDNQKGNIGFFAALFERNDIELRDVEQILNRFFASLDYAAKFPTSSDTLINTVVLMVGLVEQHLDKQELRERANNRCTQTKLNITNHDILNYSLSNLINCMFQAVTTIKSITKHAGGGSIFTTRTPEEMLTIETKDFSTAKLLGENHKSQHFFKQLINYSNSGNCNYWMWDDYQKIIELSGHIE